MRQSGRAEICCFSIIRSFYNGILHDVRAKRSFVPDIIILYFSIPDYAQKERCRILKFVQIYVGFCIDNMERGVYNRVILRANLLKNRDAKPRV